MTDIDDIRDANRAAGYHFFDADTLAFFKSIIYTPVYGGYFFVTSERAPHGGLRRFTVRNACSNGSIDTVGEGFQAYATQAGAVKAAKTAGAYHVHVEHQRAGGLV
jgi:hypothetical protein